MDFTLQKVTENERQVLWNWEVQPARGSESAHRFWKSVIDDFTNANNQINDGVFVFHNSATDDNYESLFEGIRTHEEDERVSPATAGADDASREKRVRNYHKKGEL